MSTQNQPTDTVEHGSPTPFRMILLLIGIFLLPLFFSITTLGVQVVGNNCGSSATVPFLDVAGNAFLCQISKAYFSGLTNGTSATTYSPSANVTREQMAAFITRTLDVSLSRGSKRAALNQWWTPRSSAATFNHYGTAATAAHRVQSDGINVFVSREASLLRMGGGRLKLQISIQHMGPIVACWFLGPWVVAADRGAGNGLGQLLVTKKDLGLWYLASQDLVATPDGLAFDGEHIFVGSEGNSISIVTPNFNNASFPKINVGGFSEPRNLIFDGTYMWLVEAGTGYLRQIDSGGDVQRSVQVGAYPLAPAFDGVNIWVPNYGSNSVSVVRASTGAVVATLSGNGLSTPSAAAFDGQRILVTNENAGTVSLFRASDLAGLGSVGLPGAASPRGVCSDGVNFWIATSNGLIQF